MLDEREAPLCDRAQGMRELLTAAVAAGVSPSFIQQVRLTCSTLEETWEGMDRLDEQNAIVEHLQSRLPQVERHEPRGGNSLLRRS